MFTFLQDAVVALQQDAMLFAIMAMSLATIVLSLLQYAVVALQQDAMLFAIMAMSLATIVLSFHVFIIRGDAIVALRKIITALYFYLSKTKQPYFDFSDDDYSAAIRKVLKLQEWKRQNPGPVVVPDEYHTFRKQEDGNLFWLVDPDNLTTIWYNVWVSDAGDNPRLITTDNEHPKFLLARSDTECFKHLLLNFHADNPDEPVDAESTGMAFRQCLQNDAETFFQRNPGVIEEVKQRVQASRLMQSPSRAVLRNDQMSELASSVERIDQSLRQQATNYAELLCSTRQLLAYQNEVLEQGDRNKEQNDRIRGEINSIRGDLKEQGDRIMLLLAHFMEGQNDIGEELQAQGDDGDDDDDGGGGGGGGGGDDPLPKDLLLLPHHPEGSDGNDQPGGN